jgi:nucleotide-binding universal stress UspA family protein
VKTILAAVDFSAVTPRVVELAGDLAQAPHFNVVVLHVVRRPQWVTPHETEVVNLGELTAETERAADEELHDYTTRLQDRAVHAEAVRLTGDPAGDIIEQAKDLPADYIVIGSHGHTAFHDLILGSVASAVLKRSPCPVIVVPPNRKRAQGPLPATGGTRTQQPMAVP